MADRQYDPEFAQQINDLVAQGVDAHTAAMQLLQARGMSPVDANTWWSFNQGAYKVDPNTKQIGEHKSAIDNPLIKAAVLAPMIAGGGFAASGALGGAAGSAGGGLPGLGTAGAVGPGGAAAGGGMSILGGLGGWGGIADLGLKGLGAVAKGRAAGRQAEQDANAQYDKLRLEAAKHNEGLPGTRAGAAVRGDTLANVQDFVLSGSGRNLSGAGGLRPSILSNDTRALGKSMSRQALLSQMGQGGANDPYAQFTPQAQPQAGIADKILQGAGYAGAGLDILDQLRKRNQGQY